uniref:Cytochrome c class I n=1 Tax=Caulobacter sp. (strain K31) TaxID=366602 RepID=B0SWG5_CAUSK
MSARAGDAPTVAPRRILWGLVAAASSVLAGCAALAPLHPGPDLPLVETGRALALSECSSCHAVGAGGGAPATEAPSFSSVAERYRNYRLDWELETISQVGHYRMPAKMLTSAEISALSAYIRTLDSGKPSEASTPPAH